MKKLFSGKFRGIPAGVLVSILLAIIVTGGVVAVTGYTLWQGSVNVTVTEPIHIWYGLNGSDNCTEGLALGDPMPNMDIFPGDCNFTYFMITSDSSAGLLIKATVTASNTTWITHSFDGDVEGDGVVVSDIAPLYFRRLVCIDGSAPVDVYNITTSFTRDSAP